MLILKKDLIKKIVAWCLVVLWMCIIFHFSAQVSKKSDKTSSSTIKKVASAISPSFRKLPEKVKDKKVRPYNNMVRKCAHFIEYAVLGILSYIAFLQHKKTSKNTLKYALLLSVLYAISDEIHQYFVPGRACRWLDVLIDTGGATVGIFLIMILIKIYTKEKEKYDRKQKTA